MVNLGPGSFCLLLLLAELCFRYFSVDRSVGFAKSSFLNGWNGPVYGFLTSSSKNYRSSLTDGWDYGVDAFSFLGNYVSAGDRDL